MVIAPRVVGPRNGPPPVPIPERFWTKVARGEPDECWPWTAARIGGRYGVIGSNADGNFLAHRIAWELTNGPVPAGLCVLHRCDNPPCCNPAHLWLGTYADNNADMARKGRHAARVRDGWGVRGEQHGMAILTEDQVREIRAGGRPTAEYAAAYGVSRTCIKDARRGKTWGHLT
jgi:hypothetical protein